MDLGGQSTPGAAQRVVVGLGDRRILVIRLSPLCPPQRAHRRRADVRAPPSSRSTAAGPSRRRARHRPNAGAAHRRSADRYRRTKTAGGVSKPSATARNRRADPAAAHNSSEITPTPVTGPIVAPTPQIIRRHALVAEALAWWEEQGDEGVSIA